MFPLTTTDQGSQKNEVGKERDDLNIWNSNDRLFEIHDCKKV